MNSWTLGAGQPLNASSRAWVAWAFVVFGTALGPTRVDAQEPALPMSREAQAYLTAALDTIQAVTMAGDTLPWAMIRDTAFYYAYGARQASDTYGAIDWALQRANRHSFLQATRPGVVSTAIEGRYGYVRIPRAGGAAIPVADSLHTAVRSLQASNVCGWIIDLRGNGGGNMWPMLAGIGPLLGDSVVGYFEFDVETQSWYYRDGVSGILHTSGKVDTVSQVTVDPLPTVPIAAPIAVLIDGGTGSSGEAMAVAFRGRPNTRTFGRSSAGFATVNRGSRLSDGANMVVTSGYYADRHQQRITGSMEPDETVSGSVLGWPFPTDRVADAARRWLSDQPSCN